MAKEIKTGPGVEELPPAGDERREVLKAREDSLQEQAEALASEREVYALDPNKMEIENELAQYFDELQVNDADPNYAYCWVQTGGSGRHVQRKLYMGWEVVKGNDPEAAALKGTDTTRRLGDVLLMKIHKDRKKVIDMREDYKKSQQELGVAGALEELQDKYAKYGARIHVASGAMAQQVGRMGNQALAQQQATRQMDQWIRQGRMPGMVMEQ